MQRPESHGRIHTVKKLATFVLIYLAMAVAAVALGYFAMVLDHVLSVYFPWSVR